MRQEDNRVVRVLIVSDSHLIRSGLRRILDSEVRIRVVGDMNLEKASAFDPIIGQAPDVLLIELDSRARDMPKLLTSLTTLKKESTVLVMSDLVDHDLAQKALALGAAGIVLKVQPPAVLIAAILDLYRNNCHDSLSKVMGTEQAHVQKGYRATSNDPEVTKRFDTLTVREREIIRLVSLGLKNKDIAHQLSISDITVRHHLSSIFCKLEVSDRQKLLILAHRNGLADLTLRTESA